MRNKLLALLLVIGSVLMTGCGGTKESTKEPVQQEETIKEESEETEAEVKPDFDWSTGELAKAIPLPDTDMTIIKFDEKHIFEAMVNGSKDAFSEYVKKCKDAGFTYINRDSDDYYNAWNEEGVRLSIDLDGMQYEVTVRPSLISDIIIWPQHGLGALLPNPNKEKGTIISDYEEEFSAVVADISVEEFNIYIEEAIKAGFSVDYNRDSDFFEAKNSNGNKLYLEYGGKNAMTITVYLESSY